MKGHPRIGIMVRPIEKGVSGSGMHLARILRAAAESNPDFAFVFLAHSQKELEVTRYGTVVKISRNPFLASWQLRRSQLDLIHFNPLSIFAPVWLPGVARCATLHPEDEFIIPEHFSWIRRVHAHGVIKTYARRMDAIFTVSETSKRLLIDTLGIREERIILTPNAADERFRRLAIEEFLETKRRYCPNGDYILHVSNFSARKNPWTLLRAFQKLAASPEVNHLRLLIVGHGWKESAEVRRFLANHSLESRVVLTGFLPTLELPRLFNAALAFVFPSLSEGFGMPNLEAMACGCPVITSRCFAIPEVVGDAAVLLDSPSDADELCEKLRQLVVDEGRRALLRERGLLRARKFSWERSASALLDGYRRILTTRSVEFSSSSGPPRVEYHRNG
jgi:glycosyltransferase involved in cell wall biosynthesis